MKLHIYWSGRACYDGFFKSARKHAFMAFGLASSLRGASFRQASLKAVVRAMVYSLRLKKVKNI